MGNKASYTLSYASNCPIYRCNTQLGMAHTDRSVVMVCGVMTKVSRGWNHEMGWLR